MVTMSPLNFIQLPQTNLTYKIRPLTYHFDIERVQLLTFALCERLKLKTKKQTISLNLSPTVFKQPFTNF